MYCEHEASDAAAAIGVTPDAAWWHGALIYQIYPLSFCDASGDGKGDLEGIIAKLDYLTNTLGVDAIWLSPIYLSPMLDFGYDITDHCRINPIFGDMATFERLLHEAHARRLKVLLDFVPNHTSSEHPWFIEAISSRDNPRQDWYVFRDSQPGGGPPNNWLAVFSGSSWQWHESRRQWSLHSFLHEIADLNWRNPDVAKAMLDAMRFWLDRGVDGFRMDVPNHIMKHPDLPDNPPAPTDAMNTYKDMGEWSRQLQLHNKNQPEGHEVYRQMRAVLDSYGPKNPRVMLGEIHIFDWREWAQYYGEKLDEFHLPFNFGLLNPEWNAQHVRKIIEDVEAALPPGAWANWVLGNHDEPRIASRFGEARARLATMLLLTLRGVATLYYGDEIGLPQAVIPAAQARDIWAKRVPDRPDLNRDGCRTPMQWSDEPGAHFSLRDAPEPWLPITGDYATRNVASQLRDPASMLSLARALISQRRQSPALRLGAYRTITDGIAASCFAFSRGVGDDEAKIILNFTNQPQRIDLADPRLTLSISTHGPCNATPLAAGFTLRPDEGAVFLKPRREHRK